MYSCVARSSIRQQFNTTFDFLHAYRPQHVSQKRPAVTPRQGGIWHCRWRIADIGRDWYLLARTAHDALHFGSRRLLCESVAARASMDAATSPARSRLAQLGRRSQPDAPDKMRSDHFNGVDDGGFRLGLCRSTMDTDNLGAAGIDRCSDRIAYTDTRSQHRVATPINHLSK